MTSSGTHSTVSTQDAGGALCCSCWCMDMVTVSRHCARA